MLTDIREILIFSTPKDTPRFEDLLEDGSQRGSDIYYTAQASPYGLAQAFIIGDSFLKNVSTALALGDNILYRHTFPELLGSANDLEEGATIFAYHVYDPER